MNSKRKRRRRPAPRLVLQDPLSENPNPALRSFLDQRAALTDAGRRTRGTLRANHVRAWARQIAIELNALPAEDWQQRFEAYRAGVDTGKPCRPTARQRLLLDFTRSHRLEELLRNYWRLPDLRERVRDFVERHPEDEWSPVLSTLADFAEDGSTPTLSRLAPAQTLILLPALPMAGRRKLALAAQLGSQNPSVSKVQIARVCNLGAEEIREVLSLPGETQTWLRERVESLYLKRPLLTLAALRTVGNSLSLKLRGPLLKPEVGFGPRPGVPLEIALWAELEASVKTRASTPEQGAPPT